MFQTNFSKGILAMLGCFLLSCSIGEFDLLSSLYVYIASYLRNYDNEITHSSIAIIPTIWLSTQIVSNPLAIVLYSKFGFK